MAQVHRFEPRFGPGPCVFLADRLAQPSDLLAVEPARPAYVLPLLRPRPFEFGAEPLQLVRDPLHGIRSLPQLPPHESAWAMTVHKSQGSEFEHVVLVLPDAPSELMTRELVYTAVTRARKRVTLLGDPALIGQAVRRPQIRESGLINRLSKVRS